MPSTTALRKCPDLIFVKPRFDVYRAVSRQVHGIFADYTDLIEPLALDEAYLDVTKNRRGLPTASATAKEIRARIFELTGLTASAGVSYNKFLAKLASGQRKPNGQFVIPPEAGPGFIEQLPVSEFHGVGPVTAEKMRRLGIHTGADLKTMPLGLLQRHFGKSASWYLGIANGEDNRPVVADRQRKSSGAETTFAHDLTAPAEIDDGVAAMAEKVWAWCEKTRVYGRTVTVKVKFADFQQITRSHSFAAAVAKRETLIEASLRLVRTALPTNQGIRLLGVTVSNFESATPDVKALPLFAGDAAGATHQLMSGVSLHRTRSSTRSCFRLPTTGQRPSLRCLEQQSRSLCWKQPCRLMGPRKVKFDALRPNRSSSDSPALCPIHQA